MIFKKQPQKTIKTHRYFGTQPYIWLVRIVTPRMKILSDTDVKLNRAVYRMAVYIITYL